MFLSDNQKLTDKLVTAEAPVLAALKAEKKRKASERKAAILEKKAKKELKHEASKQFHQLKFSAASVLDSQSQCFDDVPQASASNDESDGESESEPDNADD